MNKDSEMALFDSLPYDARRVISEGVAPITIGIMVSEWESLGKPTSLAIFAQQYIDDMIAMDAASIKAHANAKKELNQMAKELGIE